MPGLVEGGSNQWWRGWKGEDVQWNIWKPADRDCSSWPVDQLLGYSTRGFTGKEYNSQCTRARETDQSLCVQLLTASEDSTVSVWNISGQKRPKV